jgi:flagellar basal-body rod protein FlgF
LADGIYVGMAAASARAAQLDSIADNLANSETPGFKAARPAFQSFLPAQGGARSTDKVFAAAVSTGTDLRAGTTVATDNPMDVLPEGDLFLGVETAAGPAYTRNGKIEVSPDGQLQVMGHAVLSAGGTTISVPQGSVPTIKENGDVLVDGSTVDTIGMFKLQGPIDRQGNALFSPAAGATAEAIDGAKLQIGTIELGNVPALESTVAMIGAQRHFETAMQAIQTYKKLDERAIEVGKVR